MHGVVVMTETLETAFLGLFEPIFRFHEINQPPSFTTYIYTHNIRISVGISSVLFCLRVRADTAVSDNGEIIQKS